MAFQGDSIFWVELEKVVPNPYQPRREFDEEKLQELSESIRMYGVLQPLTVSRKEMSREDGTFYTEYELIAGERRLRASRLAGLSQVPVIIREGEDSEQEKLELAIIENLQREDLNAVDRALAFKQLADTFGLSHAQVAKKVGRSREYVSNSIRILNLPDYILSSLRRGDISEGHARTLLMLSDKPEELDTVYREILLKKLSVREVERIARKIATDRVRKKEWKGTDPELMEIEKQFNEALGTRVSILKTDYGGKLTIDYFSQDDLEAMLLRLREDARSGDEASARENDTAWQNLSASTPLAAPANADSAPLSSVNESDEASKGPDHLQPEEEGGEAHAQPESDRGEVPAHNEVEKTEEMPQESQHDQPEEPIPSPHEPDPHPMPYQPTVPAPVPEPQSPEDPAPTPEEDPEPSPDPAPDAESESETTPDAPPAADKQDDGDLYSIKNFSI